MIMSLGLPAALMNSSIGPVDNTQYDPINKWRVIATCVVNTAGGPTRLDRNDLWGDIVLIWWALPRLVYTWNSYLVLRKGLNLLLKNTGEKSLLDP